MNVTIGTTEVDMHPDDLPGFSFAIDDPLKPGTVAGTSSTTFKLPATNAAKQAMGGASMAEEPIETDPELIIGNGYVQTLIRPIEWDDEEIRAVALGNNSGWIADLKATKINELDLGESPRIDQSTMQDTWFDEDSLLYFPVIDYGFDWELEVHPSVAEIRPGTRCHVLLKKAFAKLGYSVKVVGSLRNVWKKFILPCTQDINAGERTRDLHTMKLTQNVQSFQFYNTASTIPLPDVVNVVDDPGGNNTGTYFYTAPYNMEVEVFFDMTFSNQFANGLLMFRVYDTGTGNPISAIMNVPTLAAGTVHTKTNVSLGVVTLTQGQEIGVGLQAQFLADLTIQSCEIRFVPTAIEYQEGITVDIDSCMSKISAWDVLMGIHYTRCLSFDTDDLTKQVTISYNREKYRDIAEGRSLVGREDHTDPPVKGDPLRPERVVFAWKDDDRDLFLEEANADAGDRGWGGHIYPVNRGRLKEVRVEVPFAATAMRSYPGGLTIPVMREHDDFTTGPLDADYIGPTYRWAPRILMEDGMASGTWEFDLGVVTAYPKCFFVFPGETDFGMSFHPETAVGTSGPGNVANHWGPYLQRFALSRTLSIDLFHYDDELQSIDLGVPVEVNDGKCLGWYYITKIDRKRFGKHEPTRTELIQV